MKKLQELFAVERDIKEVERWIFSLAPLAIAFIFFVIFLFPVETQKKDIIYVIGLTAGFTGLQTYWIIRGWKRNEGMTIILGFLGIGLAIAAAITYLYVYG
ncbi:hypothetical protein TI05_02635 [Achromatium sp. WMS3]|nr:hypothetical protein TI05_02635 [Achromatium sp. WMS3]